MSTLTTRERVSRLILCLLSVKLASKLNNSKISIVSIFALNLFGQTQLFNGLIRSILPAYGQSVLDKVASMLIRLPPIRSEYVGHINEHVNETRETTCKNWKKFGPLITEIPKEGYSEDKVMEIIDSLGDTVDEGIIGEDISGSIYPFAFRKEVESRKKNGAKNSNESYEDLMSSLEKIFAHSFTRSYLWNSLHEAEFGVGYWLNYQVIRMVADLYIKTNKTQARENIMGLVTSGGTDSLMNMVRLYGQWGKSNRNLDFGEGIMVACENIHAAVDKGCEVAGVTLVKVPCNEEGSVSIPHFKKAVRDAGSALIGCIVSTPSFTLGAVDNVKEAALIAKKAGVGLHVDSCLGGFVINFLEESYNANFLDIPGVTSLSCDTHKNGWAPKGSSVLLTLPLPDVLHKEMNLFLYSTYAIPSWDGGVYGSPGNPGSQHCSHVLQAYTSMLRIGKKGYRGIAEKINKAVNDIHDIVKKDDRIEVLGEHAMNRKGVNVIGFRIHPKMNWGVGASYALAYQMSKFKVVLSALKGDRIHYAVTGRSALDPEFSKRFEKAFVEGMKETAKSAELVLSGEAQFGGDAGLYGTLDAAMEPSSENTKSTAELLGNKLLGKRVAHDLIKAHFWALQNPFSDRLF